MTKVFSEQNKPLPDFRRFFWWIQDPGVIDLEEYKKEIILQVVNYGGWRHWQWLVRHYGKETVKEIVQEIPESAFMPRVLKLIKLLLKINKLRYASRSDYIRAKKNL
ncbi:MAG: hypothetical protein Q8N16_02635 [bacterium]|nr:hypothetical protein [bacterium]